MAYLPDEVIPQLSDISPSGVIYYLFHCRWRDHESKVSRATIQDCISQNVLTKSRAYAAHRELIAEGWIKEVESGAVVLLKGDFSRMDEMARRRKEKKAAARSQNVEVLSQDWEPDSQKREDNSQNWESVNIYPAPSSRVVQPSIQPPPPQTPPPSRSGGGGGFQSQFSRAEIEEWASQEPGIKVLDKFVEARLKDGTADARIRAYHARRDAQMVAAPQPAELTLEEMAGAVVTVKELLLDGESITEIEAKFKSQMKPAQWANVRSTALYEFELARKLAAEEGKGGGESWPVQ